MIDTLIDNRYRIEEEVGRGGMGIVYRAYDTHLERVVALKVLLETALMATEGRRRLLSEARAAARLDHQNIVTLFDAVESKEGSFIVMQFVDGLPLSDYQPQDLNEVVELIRQLCHALSHAHEQGVIHRDIKPANVLINNQSSAMLMDFGLARSLDKRLTVEGGFAGTLDYIAPEQALGDPLDGRADLYSLGVMLYELSTGQLPFTAEDPVSILTQHLYAPAVPPRAKNEAISPQLNQLIIDLLEKDPELRPKSAAEVADRLDHISHLGVDLEMPPAPELSVLERIARGRMIGREVELEEARSLWNKAIAAQGQTLLISGEPGIGKTRLVRELTTLAEVTGGRALVGACYPEGGAPYAPFSLIVHRALIGGPNGLQLPNFVMAELLNMVPELRIHYEDILPNPPLDAQAGQRRLFDSITLFSQALCQDRAVLVVLEDAHWADDGTLALLRHLARRSRHHSLMFVATYREVELDQNLPFNQVLMSLQRERLASRIKLTRLDRAQTERLLTGLFSEEITPEFLEGIYRETEGNPFFIEEVCKSLVESGELYFEGGEWHRPSMRELAIPQTVRVAVQSRIAVLDEKVQDILQLAAVIGREFDFDTLLAAGSWDEDSIIDALELAEHAQLVEEVSSERGATYNFVHALIPATLAEALSGLRQRRIHRRIAQVIEERRPDDWAMLAYHYRLAQDKDKALLYLGKAGERAKDRFSNEDAIRLYSQALEFELTPEERFDLLISRVGVYHLVAAREEESQDIDELLEITEGMTDDGCRIDALLAQANFLLETDHFKAREPSKQAANLARIINDPVREAKALRQSGTAYWYASDFQRSQQELQAAAERFQEADLPADRAASLHMLSLAYGELGDRDKALKTALEALDESRRAGDKVQEATSLRRIAIAYHNERAFAKALPYAEKARDLHRQLGDRSEEVAALNVLGLNHLNLKNTIDGIEYLNESLALAVEIESQTGIQFAIFNLSGALVKDHLYEEAWKFLEDKIAQYKDSQDRWLLGMLYWNLAMGGYLIGDYPNMIANMELALTFMEGILPPSQQGAWRAFIATALAETGDLQKAREELENAKTLIQDVEDPSALGNLYRNQALLSLLAKSGMEKAVEKSEQACALFEKSNSDAMVIWTLNIQARLYVALGQPEEARKSVKRFLNLMETSFVVFRPQECWFTQFQVERALGDDDAAAQALKKAHEIFCSIQSNIQEEYFQGCWRENIPDNRLILQEAESRGWTQ